MSNESESEAVALAFREAVEDLQGFARNEINTLTMIARENTEHAHAISGALQEHIKRVIPPKKLPALYLLDSIVKNVGTPYTLYFGRKLYQTFMDAYASVDMATRRKMDEMLRTWKEPVPGSLDTRPVFPLDVTRPIENALIKARTTALQTQREHARGQQQLFGRGRPMNQGMPYRDTPTPPGVHLPQVNGYQNHTPVPTVNGSSYPHPAQSSAGYPPTHLSQPPPSRSTPQPMPTTMAFQPPQLGGYGVPKAVISIDALNDDIRRLISASKAQIAQAPHDPSLQRRLKALVDLQTILQTQNLPQDQLVLVKNQIADLAVTIRAAPTQTTPPTPVPQPVAVAPPPAAAPKISIDSLFGPGALATLMARKSTTPQASTPYPPPPVVSVPTPPPQRVEPQKPVITHPPPPPAPTDPMALMNMLRLAGLLPPAPPASSSTAASHPTPPIPFPMPMSIPRIPPISQSVGPVTLESLAGDIALRPSSLKQFRPNLLPFLYGTLGPQCTQCGRRFPKDEEGKKDKTRHMDWHFRVNQRIAEVEKRGQHRSWLVDEMDWIKTRETIDKDHVAPPTDYNAATGGSAPKAPQLQYIPVPDDPSLANSVCSICQEKFETRWLDDAQEFVWPDTMRVGEKIYHASCYQEAFKGSGNNGGNTQSYARGTPEPVTGKRKAEDELTSATRSKVKVEGT
ncbi:uncharacterized protein GGS22DRAFT_45314 [Annulohypoxylon maeteangense]|uniref:uncharacterized protein n=1 Tax=Annulohypoxylon maeteangense TaxID=1927788 RepID=UPI0020078314|nr:uncharacterized protein GGS22DRAFT_45314 [Annulohypoxylon maeteangense]KAI0882501.1 hypothetical protein GGS22DRAFT_45314 [Annulohypoxylon maeteangense]